MKPTKRIKPSKPYWKMNTKELAEATKEFDRPIPLSKTRPLSKEQRERWERARRQPSRSVFIVESAERGVEPVLLELDGELLKRADAYAKSHQMTRAQLIDRSLRSILSFVEAPAKQQRSRKSA